MLNGKHWTDEEEEAEEDDDARMEQLLRKI